ncbi:hypothetical protein LLH06_07900 [Mucilaginibacter daejeonensis]|uniref:hypothetical protein n=1 Tax=Mucilaginibacter daejeonensis TaxID=398049 RepID=UPI001D172C49|nr:hypothetical protein [Mucilaginibacter daejeonensis]UEG54886.1 hypothetical protein LLH06_07900 [Mucilaginibacter daejeonensis]
MNTQNAEFLKKSLLNLGFGDKMNEELERNINARLPEFTLNTSHRFDNKNVDHTLHFKAGNEQEIYFFNKYDTRITDANGQAQGDAQTFYINKGHGVTAKEAFNLMEGRAVQKQLTNLEGQRYTAWLALDDQNLTDKGSKKMKHYHENYGYDIEKVITGKGIKEMESPKAKDDLLRSLKKGNAQQVTVSGETGDRKYYIAADPQYKTVSVFNEHREKVRREELLFTSARSAKETKRTEGTQEVSHETKRSNRNKLKV